MTQEARLRPREGQDERRVRRWCWPLAVATWCVLQAAAPAAAAQDAATLLRDGQLAAAEAAARRDLAGPDGRIPRLDPARLPRAEVLLDALLANGRGAASTTAALAASIVRVVDGGGDDVARVRAIVRQSETLSAAGAFGEAAAAARRALAIAERTDAVVGAAQARHRLGAALSAAGRHAAAITALELSVRTLEAQRPDDWLALAPALEDLVLALHRHGEYAAATDPLGRLRSLRDAVAPTHPARLRVLQLATQQAWFEGRLQDARAVGEEAVALAERTLHPDHPLLAASLRYLAGTLGELGEFGRSVELKRRALAVATRAFGPTHHLRAEYLHTLGVAEADLGNYLTGRDLLTRALRLYEQRYGRHHQDLAAALSVLAEVHVSLGDHARAERDQARVVAIHTRVGGADHPYVARALVHMAAIRQRQGDAGDAARLLRRALAMQERRLGSTHRDVAATLAALAQAVHELGDRQALPLARRAVATWEALGVPDAPAYATVLLLAASISAEQGDDAAARASIERALQIRERALGPRHPLHAEAQIALAHALARGGDTGAAVRHATRGEDTARQHLVLMLRALPERQALDYARSRPRGIDLLLSLAMAQARASEDALAAVVESRAVVLDALAARNVAMRATAGEDVRRLRAAQQRLANLLVRGPGDAAPDVHVRMLDDARAESERLEEIVAARGPARAPARRGVVALAPLRAALPAGSALVSIVRYTPVRMAPVRAGTRPSRPAAPAYAAFVLRQDGAIARASLGPAATIDRLVAQWRAAVQAEAGFGTRGPAAVSSRTVGTELRRLVWHPLASSLTGVRQALVVPDGSLGLLPLAALPMGAQGYLVESGPSIHYLTAERDLLKDAPAGGGARRGLLAVGGAAFDAVPGEPAGISARAGAPSGSSGCGDLASMRFAHLEGARREVADVTRVWTNGASGDLGPVVSLVGRDAREDAVKHRAVGARVLHLATHGFFLDGRCPAPGTNVRDQTRPAARALVGGASRPPANPLLLSGLALAGANQRARAPVDADDGILTAQEVATLPLAGTEWAVLSACDSGVGQASAGEGVFGLRRAFQIAGVRTVIMSLWAVEDHAAREWMAALYRGRFQAGLASADAVHAATLGALQMRRQRRLNTSPFFWAGFVAAGDWR